MQNNTLEKWEEKTLDEVCTFTRGLTYSKKDEVELSNNIVLRANNIDLNSNSLNFDELKYINSEIIIPEDKKVKANSIMICISSGSKSHLGKVAFIDKNYGYAFGGFMGLIIPNDNILPKFLYYMLISPAFKNLIFNLTDGANINNLKYSDLKDFKLNIPPLSEQQRIVKILDEAFEDIEKAKQNALQNLNNAKELFENKSNNVFQNLLNNSSKTKMSDISDLITKGASPKWQGFEYCERSDDSILFITSENVGKEEILLNNRKYLSKDFNDKQRRSILEKGDILTNIVGASIGRTAIFDLEDLCNINQAVCLIRLKDKQCAKYITKYMNSHIAIEAMTGMIKDCARANVSLTNVADLYVPFPDSEEQQKIVAQLDELQEQTKKLEQIYEQKIKDLDELKQSILQKAFNGEL